MEEEKIKRARRLQRIKKYIENSEDFSEFEDDLKSYKKELKLLDDSKERSRKRKIGFEDDDVVTNEILKSMSPGDLIEYIKGYKSSFEKTHDDVARIFSVLVEEDPIKYVSISQRLLDKGIYPIYIYWFLEGLEKALKAGKSFEWEYVLNLCEEVIKITEEPVESSEDSKFMDYRDFGNYSWVRGEVASLIGVAFQMDSNSIPFKYFSRFKEILFTIIRNDEDPTEKNEEEFGGDNMDYITYSLNCNRGRAMHSLLEYALKFKVHQFKDSEKEKKVLFEDDVKTLLEERISEEKSPSVQSVYGIYLNNLFYLDYEWTKKLIVKRKLFPYSDDKYKFWEAHWYGFIAYGKFSKVLFTLLKDDYYKAVKFLKEPKKDKLGILKYDNKLAEHIMYAYFYTMENLDSEDGIINIFFRTASEELRSHAVYFLSTSLEGRKISDGDLERLKRIWKWRINEVQDEELDEELTGFVFWLKNWPEKIEETKDLILPIIPLLHKGHREDKLLEYINSNITDNPEYAIEILEELVNTEKSLPNLFFDLEILEDIIKKANTIINIKYRLLRIVDKLAYVGYQNLKELLKS